MNKSFSKLLAAAAATLVTLTGVSAQGESVSIKGPNCAISAVYHKPVGLLPDKKCPMVIFCHGFGGNKEGALLRQIAVRLEQQGIATLAFDFAGSGASVSDKFEFSDMTIKTEVKDLKAVIDYAEDLPFVSKVAVVGHSLGGAVSLITAADEGSGTVKALVLLAPAISVHEDALRGSMLGARFDPKDPPRKLKINEHLSIGRDFIEVAQKTNFAKIATKYKGETFVAYGSDDYVVLYTNGEFLDELMPDSEFKLYKDLDHGFGCRKDNTKTEAMYVDVVKFLVDELL